MAGRAAARRWTPAPSQHRRGVSSTAVVPLGKPLIGATREWRASVYGLATIIPVRGVIDDMLTRTMDLPYRD